MVQDFIVTLRFRFPAWNNKAGIVFQVRALTKAQAIRFAKAQAERDGHWPAVGQGAATFKAQVDLGD